MATNSDMLSLLPESLLVIILSFLPFKEAARTCILSKKWSQLWKSTKTIEFNELDFVEKNNSQESDEIKEAQRRILLNFITNWIAQYKDRTVDKFSLKISNPKNCSDIVQDCIAFATTRNAKELGLDFSDPKWEEDTNIDLDDDVHHNNNHSALFELPEHVYGNHQTLESLKLHSCGFVMCKLFKFCALKDVSFGWIELTISSIQNLLSTCKLIENLSLKRCWNMEHFDMGDENLGLKRLVIDKCNFKFDYFRFNAPFLKYFKYSGQVIGVSEINVQRHVMHEAHLDFGLVSQFDDYGNQLYKLLEDLYPVRIITVCSVLLQAIPCGEEPVKVQCGLNVRHLIMKTQMHAYELCGFMFLLNSCPSLEKLTLDIGLQKILPGYEPPYDVDLENLWENVTVPSCLRRTVKVVEVKGFRGTMDEIKACYYCIKAGRVLEEININVCKEEIDLLETRLVLARYLLTVPKASKNLKISIN